MTEESAAREVPVDLDVLMSAFGDDDYDQIHFLDVETGEIIPLPEQDFEEEDLHPVAAQVDSHPDRYLPVPKLDPDDVLEDLAAFLRDLPDEDAREKLGEALQEGLEGVDFDLFFEGQPELAEGWETFQRRRLQDRVLAWMAEHNLRPAQLPPGPGPAPETPSDPAPAPAKAEG